MRLTVRNMFGWAAANLLIMGGFVRRAKKKALNGEYILSVFFHNPSRKEFESCIKWLKKNKFNFLSAYDIDKLIKENLPFPKGGVLLTFDDGWESNVSNVVEIANRYCVPVTIFVSTAPVEEGAYWWSYVQKARVEGLNGNPVEALKEMSNENRLLWMSRFKKEVSLEREAMTIDQLKNIVHSKYVVIGGHTHTHPVLIRCKDEHVFEELKVSKEKLELWTGKEISYFAYPNGDYSTRVVEILKQLNYRLAFTNRRTDLTPEMLKNNYTLPRFGFLEGASFAENICRMVGIWNPSALKIKMPQIFK